MQDFEAGIRQRDLQGLNGTLDDASCCSYGKAMKSALFRSVLAALPLLVSAPSTAAEKRYAISDFDRVQIFGPFNVAIQTGRATSVTASGDVRALDSVSVTSSGGVLTIQTLSRTRSSWKEQPHAAARLVVVLPQLKGLRLLGAGTVSAAEMRGITTEVTLNGSGQVSIARLASDTATAQLSGSGRIRLGGTAKNFSANISGSGDLDASQLSTSDLKIVSATSGRVTARASRTANVKQNGAGEVRISGSPSCLVENPGTGSASCGD